MSQKIITLLFSVLAFVNVQADIDSSWLVNQQNLDGSFTAPNDLGYVVQNTSEALRTLYALDAINLVSEDLGIQLVDTSDSIYLENVVRKIFVNRNAGLATKALVAELKSFVNADGGFGGILGYQSTVLDTALAIQVWASTNDLLSDDFGYAVGYLTANQNIDGSWSSAGNESSVYVTAMASLALQEAQFVYNVTDKINAANNYLIIQIQNDISNIEIFEIALATLSIAPTTSDKTTYQFLLDRLLATRDLDGSWSQDTYTTALAMRALHIGEQNVAANENLSSVVTSGSAISAITGVITDNLSGQVLVGVTVTIRTVDGTSASTITDTEGHYVLSNLLPGDALVTIKLTGYHSVTATPALSAGVIYRFNPALGLQPQPVPLNIIGNVVDEATGLPLSDVNIQVISSSAMTRTGATGDFAVNDLSPGSISIDVSIPGYVGRSYVISATAGGLVNLGIVALTPGATNNNLAKLSGIITDAISGKPLYGVTISLSGADNQTAFTDVNGLFTISNVNSGDASITAVLAGYTNALSNITFVTGINAQFNVALVKSDNQAQVTLQGDAVDSETLLPVSGVTIEVIGQALSEQTNTEGKFQLGGVSSGLVKVSLSHVDYQNVVYSISAIKGSNVNLGQIKLATKTAPIVQGEIILVNVPGTSDMWLAGMPDGSTASSGDSAPALSPVFVNGIDISGSFLSFGNVTGGVNNEPGCLPDTGANCSMPDGSRILNHFPGALNGISDLIAPLNSLVGVFLDDNQPDSLPAPATLDFQTIGIDFSSIAPELKQVFFIGDGLTGSNVGEVQKFFIPEGATRLYLGTMDGNGWYNNSGAYDVEVRFKTNDIDLIITTLNVEKVSTNFQTLQVSGLAKVNIKNTGTSLPADPALITVFEDNNANELYDLDIDNVLGNITVLTGQTIDQPLDVDIPLSGIVSFRDSPIYAMVDSDAQITERDETNNVSSSKQCRVSLDAPNQSVVILADVSASLLKINDSANQSASISVRIGNGGELSIVQPININFYEGNPETGGALLGTVSLDSLASAAYQDVTLSNIPALSGNKNIYVVADANDVVQECNELNNSVSLPVFVGGNISVGLTVGTSESQYSSGSAISLQGNVINNSVLPGQFLAQLQIEDTSGNVIQTYARHNTEILAGKASININDNWESMGFLTGNYQLRGLLFDLQGELVSSASSTFNLISNIDTTTGQTTTGIRTNTDRPVYHTNDRVRINSLITNNSTDSIINNAQLRIDVINTANVTVFTRTIPISTLTAGGRLQKSVDYFFSSVAEGSYTVNAQFLTQQSLTLSSAQTSYVVESDTIQNITAESSVLSNSLDIGQQQVCTDSLKNIGDQNLVSLALQQILIDVGNNQTLQTQSQTINLATGVAQSLIRNIDTSSLVAGDYICAVQVDIAGDLRTLSFSAFKVTVPPINVEATFNLGSHGQLLVWFESIDEDDDENNKEDDRDDEDQHGEISHNDVDQIAQRQYLETLLNEAGWIYTLVDNRNAFINEFSSGQYQAYVLFNGKEKLGQSLEKALREAVNRGNGLVVVSRSNHDGRHETWLSDHGQNNALFEVLGIRVLEKSEITNNFNFVSNNALNIIGSVAFDENIYVSNLELIHAQAVLEYDALENNSAEQSQKPVVSLNEYGQGHSLYAGFDVLAYAMQHQDKTLLQELIKQALIKTHPANIAVLPSAVIPLDIAIYNLGSDATVQALLSAPDNTTWLRIVDGVINDAIIEWQYDVASDSEIHFTPWLQLPETGNDVSLTLIINAAITQGGFINQYNETLYLGMAQQVTLADIINHIEDLQSQGYKQKSLKKAAQHLNQALRHDQAGKPSLASQQALKATDDLVGEINQAIIDVRLQIDAWLRLATISSHGQWLQTVDDDDR